MLNKLSLVRKINNSSNPFETLFKRCCRCFQWKSYTTPPTGTIVNNLLDHLKQRIKATGPITVASYMKEALTNPIWGYYMNKDVFGKKGDFTTSPEVSQMFGELVAIWFVLQWSQLGKPTPLQLVELGPGRGTLMADIIRVFSQFKGNDAKNLSVHFVEVSEKMKHMQRSSLNVNKRNNGIHETEAGIPVYWHSTIQDVPKGLSFYVAHEFFDALAVHMFQKVDKEWREILVDYSRAEEILQFVVAPGPSPLAMSTIDPSFDIDNCEVCPEGAVIMSCISQNIAEHGGCGLIIDYGEAISDRHSLRGFKDHRLVENVLENPGDCDLTANVDFTFLKRAVDPKIGCHGPITQESFLLQMGIRERLQALLREATKEQSKQLISSFNYLTSTKNMGQKFKLLALTESQKDVPVPFT